MTPARVLHAQPTSSVSLWMVEANVSQLGAQTTRAWAWVKHPMTWVEVRGLIGTGIHSSQSVARLKEARQPVVVQRPQPGVQQQRAVKRLQEPAVLP